MSATEEILCETPKVATAKLRIYNPVMPVNMIYNNRGNRKSTDNSEVESYQNYKVALSVDNKKYHVRISIQIDRRDEKLYFTHIINFIRQ
ncbi:MAG: hypothetical protein IT223_05150 [Crocinitomicaceae bacterium]|nr:hypothetical protein [Crocinitomicaceae bacterium]